MFSRVLVIGAVIAAAQAGFLGLGQGGRHGGYNYNSAPGVPALSGAYSEQFVQPGLLQQTNYLAFNSALGHGNPAAGLGHGAPLGHPSILNHDPYPGVPNGVTGPHGHNFARAISHVDRTDIIQASPGGHPGAGLLSRPTILAQPAVLSPALNLPHNAHAQVTNVIHPSPAHYGSLGHVRHSSPLGQVGALAHTLPFAHSSFIAHASAVPYPAAGPLAHPGPLVHPGPLANPGPLVHPGSLANPGPLVHPGPLAQTGGLGHTVPVGYPTPLSHNSRLAPVASQAHVGRPAPLLNEYGSYGYARQYAGVENYHSYPKYQYSYSVEDPNTGDHKAQQESRDGDVVKGEYSLAQPDGSYSKVSYAADDQNGFTAVVHNSGPSHHVYSSQSHQKW